MLSGQALSLCPALWHVLFAIIVSSTGKTIISIKLFLDARTYWLILTHSIVIEDTMRS